MKVAIIMEESVGPSAGMAARANREQSFQGHQHENKILLILTLIIGAIVGLLVVAFIVLTENLGARLYPPGGAAWRRVFIPVFGALTSGILLFRSFPNARGSGIPQTKAALFLRNGYISFRTVSESSAYARSRWRVALLLGDRAHLFMWERESRPAWDVSSACRPEV
jgi:hypothetical protein